MSLAQQMELLPAAPVVNASALCRWHVVPACGGVWWVVLRNWPDGTVEEVQAFMTPSAARSFVRRQAGVTVRSCKR